MGNPLSSVQDKKISKAESKKKVFESLTKRIDKMPGGYNEYDLFSRVTRNSENTLQTLLNKIDAYEKAGFTAGQITTIFAMHTAPQKVEAVLECTIAIQAVFPDFSATHITAIAKYLEGEAVLKAIVKNLPELLAHQVPVEAVVHAAAYSSGALVRFHNLLDDLAPLVLPPQATDTSAFVLTPPSPDLNSLICELEEKGKGEVSFVFPNNEDEDLGSDSHSIGSSSNEELQPFEVSILENEEFQAIDIMELVLFNQHAWITNHAPTEADKHFADNVMKV